MRVLLFAEPKRRHCRFWLPGEEAESGERAAAENDRRPGRGAKRERAAAAAPADLFTPKDRGPGQEKTHRSPDSASVVSLNGLKFPRGAPGRWLLACGNARPVSGPRKQTPGVAGSEPASPHLSGADEWRRCFNLHSVALKRRGHLGCLCGWKVLVYGVEAPLVPNIHPRSSPNWG